MIYAITLCYASPEIIEAALNQAIQTLGEDRKLIDRWVMVNNHWPLNPKKTISELPRLAELIGAELIHTPFNLGAHPGFNYALNYLGPLSKDDLVLSYDDDSNPLQEGWLSALVNVMKADPDLGYLSLIHEHVVGNRQWQMETVGNYRVARDQTPEMFNIALYRALALRNGMLADSQYYGHMETAMFRLGLKNGYLFDYREGGNPIPHDPLYVQWKWDYGGHKTKLSFEEWLLTHKKD